MADVQNSPLPSTSTVQLKGTDASRPMLLVIRIPYLSVPHVFRCWLLLLLLLLPLLSLADLACLHVAVLVTAFVAAHAGAAATVVGDLRTYRTRLTLCSTSWSWCVVCQLRSAVYNLVLLAVVLLLPHCLCCCCCLHCYCCWCCRHR